MNEKDCTSLNLVMTLLFGLLLAPWVNADIHEQLEPVLKPAAFEVLSVAFPKRSVDQMGIVERMEFAGGGYGQLYRARLGNIDAEVAVFCRVEREHGAGRQFIRLSDKGWLTARMGRNPLIPAGTKGAVKQLRLDMRDAVRKAVRSDLPAARLVGWEEGRLKVNGRRLQAQMKGRSDSGRCFEASVSGELDYNFNARRFEPSNVVCHDYRPCVEQSAAPLPLETAADRARNVPVALSSYIGHALSEVEQALGAPDGIMKIGKITEWVYPYGHIISADGQIVTGVQQTGTP